MSYCCCMYLILRTSRINCKEMIDYNFQFAFESKIIARIAIMVDTIDRENKEKIG